MATKILREANGRFRRPRPWEHSEPQWENPSRYVVKASHIGAEAAAFMHQVEYLLPPTGTDEDYVTTNPYGEGQQFVVAIDGEKHIAKIAAVIPTNRKERFAGVVNGWPHYTPICIVRLAVHFMDVVTASGNPVSVPMTSVQFDALSPKPLPVIQRIDPPVEPVLVHAL